MDRADCRFIVSSRRKYIVEIKVSIRVCNPLYMEFTKYNAKKKTMVCM